MGTKKHDNPDSLLIRFQGETGESVLCETLCNQILIRGETSISDEFSKVKNLIEIEKGDSLILQGGADNNIYFILSGSFSIIVNGRQVAIRASGQHVGEMALIDHTARRSASVVALEASVVVSISQAEFSKIANKFPQIWQRIAVELSNRLTQRNRFLKQPHNQPVIFIGSSSESLEIGREIENSFSHDDFVVKLWNKGVFGPSATPIESLLEILRNSDFGVIIFNPDDSIISKKEKKLGPRDNVVFELGLFIGHLGRERTFIIVPHGNAIKIPTDLLGVTPLEYREGTIENLASRIGPISNELRRIIKQLGPL